jgi:hypothetical protein
VQVFLEIELGRDIHVRIAAMAPQDLASAIIKALERINAQMYDLVVRLVPLEAYEFLVGGLSF